MTDSFDPNLEVITRRPVEPARSVPLLFVHGGYAGGWCWDEHFLPWFAARGYDAHALSLRGHGNSDGHAALNGWGIEDYVDDVRRVADSLPQPPVLIGHSMGGYVVQKYLETDLAAAAVLVASVPPSGLSGPSLSLALWNPAAAFTLGSLQNFGDIWNGAATMRNALFSDRLPHDRAEALLAHMGQESTRAMTDMFSGGMAPRGGGSAVPVLVMGAGEDDLIPQAFVRATARSYAVRPQILDDIGHLMMLDAEWETAATCLLDWMRENAL